MKHITLTALIIWQVLSVTAQQLKPSILNNAGSFAGNGNLQLEWSLGEISTTSIKNDYAFFTQGFLQPDAGITSVVPVVNHPTLCGSGLDNAGSNFTNNANTILLSFTLGETASETLGNSNLLTQGILQPLPAFGGPLPVASLEFFARRISQDMVTLDWKTIQEINNKGFYIQRRKASENDFSNIGWVVSKAPNGNSSLDLHYSKADSNNFTGTSFYRLKQVDIDGTFSYSPIRTVQNTTVNNIQLQVWPIPAPKDFFVSLAGAEKGTVLIFDAIGKLIKQQSLSNGVAARIAGLSPGIYFIRMKEYPDTIQKIVVQ